MHLEVAQAIAAERRYQDQKWGTVEERPHEVGAWLLILEGELNEAKLAWQKSAGDVDALIELVQVAAVAVACLEQHGIPWAVARWGLKPESDARSRYEQMAAEHDERAKRIREELGHQRPIL